MSFEIFIWKNKNNKLFDLGCTRKYLFYLSLIGANCISIGQLYFILGLSIWFGLFLYLFRVNGAFVIQ